MCLQLQYGLRGCVPSLVGLSVVLFTPHAGYSIATVGCDDWSRVDFCSFGLIVI